MEPFLFSTRPSIRCLLRLGVANRPLRLSNSAMALSSKEGRAPSPALKPFSEMPGIKGWPLIGNIISDIKGFSSRRTGKESYLYKLQSKYGPIFRIRGIGNQWGMVVTSSPEAFEAAFRVEGEYPSRGPHEQNMMWLYHNRLQMPTPMFLSGGKEWKQTRSNAAKQVMPRRVGNFVGPLCDIAEELFSHLETIQDEAGNIQDITPEMNKWAFQGVSYFVYGEKINVYSGADPFQQEFIDAGLNYVRSVIDIALALPFYKLYPTKVYKDYKKTVRRMQRAGRQILHRQSEEIKQAIATGIVDETKAVGLLSQWLIEGKFTEEEALSQSYDMLSAGIDSTSNTASFLLYELAKQPEIQERLVQEISSVVGDKRHPSWDDLQRISLARNCVKEILRIYFPLMNLGRVLSHDAVVLGYNVPAGTGVMLNMETSTKDESVFENPEKFKPDRWNKEISGEIAPFSSLPFGFGPRACYGRRLAELELYLLMAKMLPKYRLTTEVLNMKTHRPVVHAPNLPLHINMKLRS